MVNYCCVSGCGRNSRANKYLNYYSLPKTRLRQKLWLKAAGKEDLLDKDLEKLQKTLRFCSRHFIPSFIKNRHLTDDAVPSKCLPGSLSEDEDDKIPATHEGIICDNCLQTIVGFRYKCVSCDNYDLCQKCEMQETHPQHYMLRIPCSLEFKTCDDLINKWRQFFNSEHILPKTELIDENLSSDDEPVKKYITNYTSTDLSQDVKKSIQNEVARALKAVKNQAKRKNMEKVMYPSKKVKMNLQSLADTEGVKEDSANEPEVGMVFAEVDNVFSHDVKTEQSNDGPHPEESDNLRAFYLKMGIDLSQLMVQVAPTTEEPL
ncbi:uncharacterized protein LOC121736819 [Aricia agestis]|uniref:uncharacterized protein LOC121736819 n=1 Tax=Aricia agestis TaxID=91739 RepID=UPI001C20B5B2|nr:uncharacterized protein LOC121736819 [Aricia agestis]